MTFYSVKQCFGLTDSVNLFLPIVLDLFNLITKKKQTTFQKLSLGK